MRLVKTGMCIECEEKYVWALLDGLPDNSALYIQDCRLESYESVQNVARVASITTKIAPDLVSVDVLCTTKALPSYPTTYLVLIGNLEWPPHFDLFGRSTEYVILIKS